MWMRKNEITKQSMTVILSWNTDRIEFFFFIYSYVYIDTDWFLHICHKETWPLD